MTEQRTEFLELFQDEARSRLDAMVDRLLAIERGATDPAGVDELFRHAHTIKGAAGMLGLDRVRELAHALEDRLAEVRDAERFPTELVEPLLLDVDELRRQIVGNSPSQSKFIADPALLVAPELVIDDRGPGAQQIEGTRRSVRVPAEKIDHLLDLVSETALHRSRLDYILTAEGVATASSNRITDELDVGERLIDELKDAAISMRTLPLVSVVGGFPRAVRDMARTEGKDVELELVGAETELDRVILETLPEMVTHLLRNAVAHGIETPEERERWGKARTGVLRLVARQLGSEVEITIADDGRGVTPELVAEAGSEGSLADVLAWRGLSSAEEVSDLAGRGVGLDVVKHYVEGFAGRLEVHSHAGLGTEVVLVLPVTLALIETLLVERGGRTFGFPLSSVEEVVTVGEPLLLEGRPSLEVRGRTLPLYDLAEILGATAPELGPSAQAALVAVGERRVAVACDRLLDKEELVVKPLGLIGARHGFLGGAILGNGRIALLADANFLIQGPLRMSTRVELRSAENEEQLVRRHILVVEDFLTARELQRSILEAAGYEVTVAGDGREALDLIREGLSVDLVITDVEMPRLDGFALAEAIRSNPATERLPIVIVTTRDSPEDRRRGLEVGADAYLAKRGFNQQSLLDTMKQLLGR